MKLFKFASSILISFIPGFVGMIFKPDSQSALWYDSLQKSVLSPEQSWVYIAVWSFLFILLGTALFLILKDKKQLPKKALFLFLIHLILNSLWTYFFFGLHMIYIGTAIILFMIINGLFLQKEFSKTNKYASWLFFPYITWLTFALYLNCVIIFHIVF